MDDAWAGWVLAAFGVSLLLALPGWAIIRADRREAARRVHAEAWAARLFVARIEGTADDCWGEGQSAEYRAFVDKVWSDPEAIRVDVEIQRINGAGQLVESHVRSIVRRDSVSFYVNTFEDDGALTLVSDRHQWRRDGRKVDASAFRAIADAGVAPDAALRHVDPPTSIEEALSPAFNHIAAPRALALGYRDAVGAVTYRVVSEIRRGESQFTARCHLRWGEKRTFRYDRLITVVDAETGEVIPLERFADKARPLFPHGGRRK